jgi:hypothetical protein
MSGAIENQAISKRGNPDWKQARSAIGNLGSSRSHFRNARSYKAWLRTRLDSSTGPAYHSARYFRQPAFRRAIGDRRRLSRNAVVRSLQCSTQARSPKRSILFANFCGSKVQPVDSSPDVEGRLKFSCFEQVPCPSTFGENGNVGHSAQGFDARGLDDQYRFEGGVLPCTDSYRAQKIFHVSLQREVLSHERSSFGSVERTVAVYQDLTHTSQAFSGCRDPNFQLSGRLDSGSAEQGHGSASDKAGSGNLSGVGFLGFEEEVSYNTDASLDAFGSNFGYQEMDCASTLRKNSRHSASHCTDHQQESQEQVTGPRSGENNRVPAFLGPSGVANELDDASSATPFESIFGRQILMVGPDSADRRCDGRVGSLDGATPSLVRQAANAFASDADSDDRCKRFRLGGTFGDQGGDGPNDERVFLAGPETNVVQRPGTDGFSVGSQISLESGSQESIALIGQCVHSQLPQQARWPQKLSVSDCRRVLAMGSEQRNYDIRKVHPGATKFVGGQIVASEARSKRLETSGVLVPDSADKVSGEQQIHLGLVCDALEQASAEVCLSDAAPFSLRGRRVLPALGQTGEAGRNLLQPALLDSAQSASKSASGQGSPHRGASVVAERALVAFSFGHGRFAGSANPQQVASSVPARVSKQFVGLGHGSVGFDSFKNLWSVPSARGETTDFLLKSVPLPNVRRCYSAFTRFVLPWCSRNLVDALDMTVQEADLCIADLTPKLLPAQFALVRASLAKILVYSGRVDESKTFASKSHTKTLALAIKRARPSTRPRDQADYFNAAMVFEHRIASSLDEPYHAVFRWAVFATQYFLMARSRDVWCLTTDTFLRDTSFDWFNSEEPPEKIQWWTFPRKQQAGAAGENRYHHSRVRPLFPPMARLSDENFHRICPVRAVFAWWRLVRSIVVCEPGRPFFMLRDEPTAVISFDTVRNASKRVMSDAGIDIEKFTVHSVKRTAVSFAFTKGMTIEHVCLISNTSRATIERWYAKHIDIYGISGVTNADAMLPRLIVPLQLQAAPAGYESELDEVSDEQSGSD